MATVDDALDNYERMIYDATHDGETLIRMLANAIRGEESPTPTPDVTETPIPTPDVTETPIPTPDVTETPVPTPDVTETPIPTPNVTETPIPTPNVTETPIPTPNVTEAPSPTPPPVLEPELGDVLYVDGRGWIVANFHTDYMLLIGVDFLEGYGRLPFASTRGVLNRYRYSKGTISQYAVTRGEVFGVVHEIADVVLYVPTRYDIIRHEVVMQSLSENIPRQIANTSDPGIFWTSTPCVYESQFSPPQDNVLNVFSATNMFSSTPGRHFGGQFNVIRRSSLSNFIRPAVWVRTELAAHSR